jgi:predicted nucleic acid-binding protein
MTYVLDSSAFARVATSPSVAEVLEPLVTDGLVLGTWVLALEAGYSARNAREHAALASALADWPWAQVAPEDWRRAFDVQAELAARARHRGVRLPDLLVAATAERLGAAVLHYDTDFDRIAAVTGQSVEWVVPRGSVP